MGKVVAAEGVASAVVETAVSGAVVAALCAAGAGCTADVPARMARSKRRAASASVVMCPAMISAAGAFLPYSLLLDLVSMAITLPSTETPANNPRLREYEYTSAVKFWSVAADAARPTGPAATEASPPSVSLPSVMPSMLLRVVNTSTMSVDCTPICQPTLPPVMETMMGLENFPLASRTTIAPLPRRPPTPTAILTTLGMTAMP